MKTRSIAGVPIPPDDQYPGHFPAFNSLNLTLHHLYVMSVRAINPNIPPPVVKTPDGATTRFLPVLHRINSKGYYINARSHYAPVALPLAVSAWESFLDFHVFFEPYAKILFGHPIAAKAQAFKNSSAYKKVRNDTRKRALEIATALFGKTFDMSKRPFTDFEILVTLRNRIVHDEMTNVPKAEINALRKRRLFLPRDWPGCFSWGHEIATLEVLRWSINTVAAMTETFLKLLPAKRIKGVCFSRITKEHARAMIDLHRSKGIQWNASELIAEAGELRKSRQKS